MQERQEILILGASYGSLLAAKLLLAGHSAHLVCLPAEATLINAEGFRVRLPVKGHDGLVEVDSRRLQGKVTAGGAADVDPTRYGLVALAMQEPQYAATDVRELLGKIAESRVPCMSIMNMPPLAYLARIPNLPVSSLRGCYTDPSVWDAFDPARVTLCSPDPQAFRPPEEKVNVLQVSLPTNFKAARFASDVDTAMLRALAADIEAIRFPTASGSLELPVKLKVHDSIFVPLAKWSMLITGNYRCVEVDSMRAIRDAVHSDVEASRRVYRFVGDVCKALGASDEDLVPFEKYANAALGLAKPSSAARALAAGARNIERVDKLVQTVAAQKGMQLAELDAVVARVDAWLARNRAR
ncbi:MAG TPA: hypothetical protein VJV77_07360 [Casimicrobiaceae bacterium]|nr:hypothetical protein [Casimicrobiaceae bacterium]